MTTKPSRRGALRSNAAAMLGGLFADGDLGAKVDNMFDHLIDPPTHAVSNRSL
jgi:hypothetical protein